LSTQLFDDRLFEGFRHDDAILTKIANIVRHDLGDESLPVGIGICEIEEVLFEDNVEWIDRLRGAHLHFGRFFGRGLLDRFLHFLFSH